MATAASEFEPWLNDKLKALNTDESVFGSYISGILDGDESFDDKKEALEGILSEIVESNIAAHVNEIFDKWVSCQPEEEAPKPTTEVDVQLAKLMESQSLSTTTTKREYTDEEKKIREAILSQYSQLSDHEVNDEVENGGDNENSSDMVKNTNAADVAAAARERREQAKQEAQKKKEKDKEDREKQKQMREEKKEKRKTQKGERKR